MDKSLIIGIIGTFATIVFGFLSIDLFKRKKYPGKITYIKLSLIDLLNSVANNFKEIELLHNKLPINKNLTYIKGALLNNGDVDINSKITEKDVTMELPVGCKWLDVKPTDFSDGLNVSINVDSERKASFKFDLFRKDEFVQFEGIIESESNKIGSETVDADLNFLHRIENTSKIEKKILISDKEIKYKKRTAILYSVGLFILLIVITSVSVFNLFGSKKEDVYFRKIGDQSDYFYSIRQNDNLIILSPKNGGNKTSMSIDEFNKNFKASEAKLTFWQKFKDSYWLISIQLGFFLIIVLSELFEINKARKLNKILKNKLQ